MPDPGPMPPKVLAQQAIKAWAQPAKSALALTVLLQLLAVSAWIAIAWGIGHAVSATSLGKPAGTPLLIALAGLVIRAGCLWGAETYAARTGIAMTAAARKSILDRVAETGARQLYQASSGERTSQIVDRTAKLFGYGARWLPGMRLAVIGPLIILVAVAAQSWLTAVLLLVSVLTLPIFIWLTASETAAVAKAQQASLDTLSGAFQARAAKAGLIRAFRGVGRQTGILAEASETLRQRTMSILRVAFLSTAVMEFFSSISIALVAVYVGFKLLGVFPFETGEIVTLAEGLTALVLAPEFFAPIRRLSTLHHDRADGVAAAEMIAPWLASTANTPARRLPRLATAPTLTFENAAISFAGAAPALPAFSLTARPSQITALAGPSGVGKTSCLLALLGMVHLASGEIRVDDTRLQAGDTLAESVAYLRQTPWVMEGSLADNIALARPGAALADIEAAAQKAGVMAFAGPERGGLSQKLARFGDGLSGGQRQRLALARALLRDAPILLMDEPTAHLDEAAERDFLKLLRNLAPGRTILVATHSEAVKSYCDHVVDLSHSGSEAA